MSFHFEYHTKSPNELEYNSKRVQDLLEKWGMRRHSYIKRFIYEEYFDNEKDEHKFLLEFFNNENVREEFKIQSDQNNWKELKGEIYDVAYEKIPCNMTTLNFFDRLYDAAIVRRDSGAIVKTFPIYLEENNSSPIMITDELRQLLLLANSINYDIFSKNDRNEFMFKIFKSICLGGDICQFEDFVTEYFNILKKIYKDLICVQKRRKTGDLIIKSFVYKINNLKNSNLFPSNHHNNFCYVVIDPVNRWVNVWYHAAYEYLC
ncbi:17558_t:CDS:2 [Funneliformis geosporum]|uniref:Cilia- and flagella-associated protein 300 n=1 Tax=Funneliformis geosporum TaxID=1117311 RepID=A0A9W4SNL4_9GLOM|nr:17558_t:CDS:2 [Funneliformis geosporum]CAI2175954.1 18026_t:CDS:2 [Funneliformis geosporum]